MLTRSQPGKLALLLLLLASSGCVRAGFDVSEADGAGPATDAPADVFSALEVGSLDLDAVGSFDLDAAGIDANQTNQHALSFNGVDANVDLGPLLYSSPPTAITVEAWIKPATIPSVFAHIVYNGRHGQWTSTLGPTQLTAGPSLASTWHRVALDAASTAKLVGSWHHLAMTWSQAAQQAELFIDGTSRGTLPTGSDGLTNIPMGYRPTIGSYCTLNNTYSNFYPGLIDEVRIWNVVRTQPQIKQAMSSVLNGSEPGLIGYWRFDQGSGGTAYDSSSKGHNGTINNATWTTDTPF